MSSTHRLFKDSLILAQAVGLELGILLSQGPFLFFLLRQRLSTLTGLDLAVQARLALDLQRSACLCLQCGGTKGMPSHLDQSF